jgi:two-component system, NarL family, response regulator DevR
VAQRLERHVSHGSNNGVRPKFQALDRINVAIVDDHEIVRAGLKQALERESDILIVGEARTGNEAVHIAETLRPNVMLLDVKLEDVEGPEVCRRVLAASPGTAVVMLTSYCQDNIILKSLNAGAKGYLIKDVELAEVKRTIRAVYRGHSVLDPKVAPRVIANATNGNGGRPGTTLSERDVAIIRYVAGGLTNKEIGSLVHLSSHTIKDRLEKIAAGFDVRSRAEIVAEAFRAGLI